MSESNREQVRVLAVRESRDHVDVARLTVEQRLDMMWQLALDAWWFTEAAADADQRMRRDFVRKYRRAR